MLLVLNNAGNTALYEAMSPGDSDIVRCFLDSVADKVTLLQFENKEGSTGLHVAARNGHVKVLDLAMHSLSKENRLSLLTIEDNRKSTAIAEAASTGQSEVIQFIINAVGSVKANHLLRLRNKNGENALHLAARHGKMEETLKCLGSLTEKQDLLFPQNHEDLAAYLVDTHAVDGKILNKIKLTPR